MSLLISPETNVGALLDAYPALEDILVASVPALGNLKNPVLRKTVTKSMTLDQAAQIAGADLRTLVGRLRDAIGQSGAPAPSADGAPDWAREDQVRHEIDADAMLASGEHPVGLMRQYCASLESGDIVRLKSSFRPAPLIDLMQRSGMTVYSAESSQGRYVTWFRR